MHTIFTRKEITLLQRLRTIWKDNIKMDLIGNCERVGWMKFAP
jgi:hypothetical protein